MKQICKCVVLMAGALITFFTCLMVGTKLLAVIAAWLH